MTSKIEIYTGPLCNYCNLAIDLLKATKNQTQTAKLLRCGFNVINRIIHRSVERGMKRRPKDVAFSHLSIDEKSFKRGHQYVTVLSSRPLKIGQFYCSESILVSKL